MLSKSGRLLRLPTGWTPRGVAEVAAGAAAASGCGGCTLPLRKQARMWHGPCDRMHRQPTQPCVLHSLGRACACRISSCLSLTLARSRPCRASRYVPPEAMDGWLALKRLCARLQGARHARAPEGRAGCQRRRQHRGRTAPVGSMPGPRLRSRRVSGVGGHRPQGLQLAVWEVDPVGCRVRGQNLRFQGCERTHPGAPQCGRSLRREPHVHDCNGGSRTCARLGQEEDGLAMVGDGGRHSRAGRGLAAQGVPRRCPGACHAG